MHTGGRRLAYKILVQKLRLGRHLGGLEVHVRGSIKMDIDKNVFDMVNWIVLAQDNE
jgi:hypothetical protein